MMGLDRTIKASGSEQGQPPDRESGTVTLTRTKTKKPSMYKVLLLNDDYTPMEFVVYVLQRFFQERGRINPHNAACASKRRRHMWRIYL